MRLLEGVPSLCNRARIPPEEMRFSFFRPPKKSEVLARVEREGNAVIAEKQTKYLLWNKLSANKGDGEKR